MKKSPFEKITRLNAPGVDNAVKMPIEEGFNDNAGKRIAMESIKKTLEVIANQPGTPVDKIPKPIIGKPGKPIIIKPIPGKPKPGKPGDNFEGPLPGPKLPGKPIPVKYETKK